MSDIHEEMEISDRIRAEDEFPHMKPKIMPRELNNKVSFSDWDKAYFLPSCETVPGKHPVPPPLDHLKP